MTDPPFPPAALVLADAVRVIQLDPEAVALAFPRARTANTRRAYAQDLRHFLDFVASIRHQATTGSSDFDLVELRRICIAWRDWMTETEAAPRTVNRRLACLRSYFREKVLRGEMTYNPAAGVEGVKVRGDAELITLTQDEARAMLDACRADMSPLGLRDLALLSLLLRTGVRSSELLGATHASIGAEEEWHAFQYRAKGGDRRRTKVPADVVARLDAWREALEYLAQRGPLPPEAPLWRGLRGPRRHERHRIDRWGLHRSPRLSKSGLDDVVARRCRQAGIAKLVRGQAVGVTPHVLRRTFVTLARDAGCEIDRIQYAVGHADLRTTQAYYANRDAFHDHAVDYLHGL